MGNLISRPTFAERFIVEQTKKPIKDGYTIESYQQRSTIPGAGMGLFTRHELPPDIVIIGNQQPNQQPLLSQMNDPLFSLGTLVDCHNGEDFFTRWQWVHRDYHNEQYAEQRVNCKVLIDDSRQMVIITIKTIPPNGELFRCYGFSTWLAIGINETADPIIQILNADNIDGFVRFLKLWLNTNQEDPLYKQITCVHDVLEARLDQLRGESFDQELKQVVTKIQLRHEVGEIFSGLLSGSVDAHDQVAALV